MFKNLHFFWTSIYKNLCKFLEMKLKKTLFLMFWQIEILQRTLERSIVYKDVKNGYLEFDHRGT